MAQLLDDVTVHDETASKPNSRRPFAVMARDAHSWRVIVVGRFETKKAAQACARKARKHQWTL